MILDRDGKGIELGLEPVSSADLPEFLRKQREGLHEADDEENNGTFVKPDPFIRIVDIVRDFNLPGPAEWGNRRNALVLAEVEQVVLLGIGWRCDKSGDAETEGGGRKTCVHRAEFF